jgi:hypothetical protein
VAAPTTTPNPHRPVAVKWLLAALAVALPLQLLFTVVVSEPYPAITFPSFGKSPTSDTAVAPDARFSVTFADGQTVDVATEELFADMDVSRQAFLQKAFPRRDPRELRGDSPVAAIRRWVNRHLTGNGVNDPGTADWLAERLAELYPGRAATTVTMTWVNTEIEPRSGDIVGEDTVRTYTVDLSGRGGAG